MNSTFPANLPSAHHPPLQILILAPQPFFQERGTPIAVRHLAEELAKDGNAVDLLVFHEGNPIELNGVTLHRTTRIPGVHGIKPGFSLKKLLYDALLFCKSLALIRRKNYHLVHAVEEAAFIGLLLQLCFDIPYVYDMDSLLSLQLTEKFPFLYPLAGIMEWCEKKVMRRSKGILAVCHSLEEKAKTMAPQVPVFRLEDFSLLERASGISEDLRQTRRIPGCMFMYVGNLEHYQGIGLLLEAFALFASLEPGKASLVIIGGSARDIEHYRQRAGQLATGGQVFFLGPRPVEHLSQYLTQADVLVSPRIQGNNTPMKIYSYLDSGRPVLATRMDTHTQVLDDEIALLAEPTPQALMQAMAALQADSRLRERLALAASERVRQHYSREAFSLKLRQFYTEVATSMQRGS